MKSLLAVFAMGMAAVCPVRASITFNVTYGSSITSLSNAAAIESLITNTLAIYSNTFSDPITVSIEFDNGGGLGESSSIPYTNVSYLAYRTALAGDARSTDDATALANLPISSTDPVLGQTNITIKSANGRAAGLNTPAATTNLNDSNCTVAGTYDGCIAVNFAATDIGNGSTSGSYSAQEVLEHEIDEILGLGSNLEGVNCGSSCSTTTVTGYAGEVSPEDLFRYTSGGSRTYVAGQTCSSIANNAYFSIDGGSTLLDRFNQACNGGDFADWVVHSPAQVQDWQGTAGADPGLGVEARALDVLGYDLAAPEPATFAMVGGVLLAAFVLRRFLN